MSELREAAKFAARLYRQRAGTALDAYVRRDKLARLQLRPGRVDPYSICAQIRADGAIRPTRTGDLVTASHRICNAVLRDRRFGTVPPEGFGRSERDSLEASFLTMNPPDHTRLRKLALPSFSPKAVATYDKFARHGALLGSAIDGITSVRQAAALMAGDAKIRALFDRLVELRRREPGEDIVSRLIAAEGDQIEPAELWPLLMLLLIAGFETTVNLIGNGVLALLDHPQQWDDLCADPAALAPKVVEEALRFDPPVQRTAGTHWKILNWRGHPSVRARK